MSQTRSAEYVVPIAAPPEVVWKALTDPRELTRWFPLTAQVTPGTGGEMRLRWGDQSGDDMPILVWEPARHLSVGMAKPPESVRNGDEPHVVTDFRLEETGGSTVLRVVAHGFDPDAKWDDFFNGIRRGWRYELQSLRHYLEHHRSQDRAVAWVRTPIAVSAERAWATLFGSGGWRADAPIERARRDDRYSVTAPDGTVITGTVVIAEHPRDFTGTAEGADLNNAFLRMQVDAVGGRLELSLWLEAWGVEPTRLAALQTAWQPALSRLFARAA